MNLGSAVDSGTDFAALLECPEQAHAESAASGGRLRTIPPNSVRARPKRRPRVSSRAPVSRIAAERMNSAPTVAIAGLAKPLKVSSGVRTPATARPTIKNRDTTTPHAILVFMDSPFVLSVVDARFQA